MLLLDARVAATNGGALPQTGQSFARTHGVRIGRTACTAGTSGTRRARIRPG
jgi:hypothetical protein